MEKLTTTRGINLTDYHFHQWSFTTLRHGKIIATLLFITIAMMVSVAFYTAKQNRHIALQQQHLQQQKTKLAYLNERITAFHHPETEKETAIPKSDIQQFMQLIQQIPTRYAGLSFVHLSWENKTQLKLVGKYENQQDLSLLKKYLTEKQLRFSVEQLQTNEKGKVDFSLVITQD